MRLGRVRSVLLVLALLALVASAFAVHSAQSAQAARVHRLTDNDPVDLYCQFVGQSGSDAGGGHYDFRVVTDCSNMPGSNVVSYSIGIVVQWCNDNGFNQCDGTWHNGPSFASCSTSNAADYCPPPMGSNYRATNLGGFWARVCHDAMASFNDSDGDEDPAGETVYMRTGICGGLVHMGY